MIMNIFWFLKQQERQIYELIGLSERASRDIVDEIVLHLNKKWGTLVFINGSPSL